MAEIFKQRIIKKYQPSDWLPADSQNCLSPEGHIVGIASDTKHRALCREVRGGLPSQEVCDLCWPVRDVLGRVDVGGLPGTLLLLREFLEGDVLPVGLLRPKLPVT